MFLVVRKCEEVRGTTISTFCSHLRTHTRKTPQNDPSRENGGFFTPSKQGHLRVVVKLFANATIWGPFKASSLFPLPEDAVLEGNRGKGGFPPPRLSNAYFRKNLFFWTKSCLWRCQQRAHTGGGLNTGGGVSTFT